MAKTAPHRAPPEIPSSHLASQKKNPTTFRLPGLILPQSGSLWQQLAHRFAVVEDVHRSAGAVREGAAWIDADGPVHGAEHLRGGDPAIARGFAARARGADRLAHAEPAAGD